MIVGYQLGNIHPQELISKATSLPTWRHDPATFARMWDQIGLETDTEWSTRADVRWWSDLGWDPKDYEWMDPGDRVLVFVVRRVV